MGNLLTYSGIVTKIRAMQANLIHEEDYSAIAELESTADFFAFLKNHPGYQDIFESYDEHGLHRGEAEGVLIYSLYMVFKKIYEFAGIRQRKALDFTIFRFEVNLIKACLQKLYNPHREYDLSIFSDFFNRHSSLDVNALSASRTMDDFVHNLRNTEYYPLFKDLLSKEGTTPFDYQMQLDIYYFKKAWKLKENLNGEDYKAVCQSLGTEIDLLNIMWLYRSKKYFFARTSETFGYVIPVTYKLTKENLLKLTDAPSVEEFISVLKKTYYEKLCSSLSDGTIENACYKLLDKIYKTNSQKYPASICPVNYYLFQKQKELKRLTSALECIRYKLPSQDTLRYVLSN
ncbi:MAG: V-type ATP synthase subunit C [Lachnoclostridium sp.]